MDTLLYEGIQIMVLGMGTVFMFLIILIVTMGIIAKFIKLINKILPEPLEAKPAHPPTVSADEGSAIAIAIAAAHMKK